MVSKYYNIFTTTDTIRHKYYNIIKSGYKYQDKIKHELLNPTYEAKCVEYLEEGDTLYVVAK